MFCSIAKSLSSANGIKAHVIHEYCNMLETLEAGQWWDVNKDVKGQYYDLQLFCGCRCGVSAAAKTAKHSLATPHNTDEYHAHHPPAANL